MNKAVISGIGIVSPLGITTGSFYDNLCSGMSNFSIEDLVYEKYQKGFVSSRVEKRDLDTILDAVGDSYRDTPGIAFAIYAARQALTDSSLDLPSGSKVNVYSGNGDSESTLLDRYLASGKVKLPQMYSSHCISKEISRSLGFRGDNITMHNTCASSIIALEAGVDDIESGRSKVSICGATDAFSNKIFAGFSSLKALVSDRCKPFSSERKGIVISEGAIFFVLEEQEHALERGADIYCEINGIGLSNDSFHLTKPSPYGISLAIREAATKSQLNFDDISCIYAHATGTKANDYAEYEALSNCFSDIPIPPIVAIKSSLGHMMAVAGAANVASAALSIKHGVLPPSLYSQPIEDLFKIDLVEKVRVTSPKTILCNAFGFGGNNGAIIISGVNQ